MIREFMPQGWRTRTPDRAGWAWTQQLKPIYWAKRCVSGGLWRREISPWPPWMCSMFLGALWMYWSVCDGEEAFAAKFKGQKFSAENTLQGGESRDAAVQYYLNFRLVVCWSSFHSALGARGAGNGSFSFSVYLESSKMIAEFTRIVWKN